MSHQRAAEAKRVTWIGLGINILLTLFKFIAGIMGRSGAMIADAIHSLSDFATDIAVLIGFRFAGELPDKEHRYGHGKYETLATAFVGGMLIVVGVGILVKGGMKIAQSLHGEPLEEPGMIALVAALISLLSKELLFRYTRFVGEKIKSPAIIANAWHHRSDAISSIAALLGIGGAIFLDERWRVLDPIAAVIVSLLIIKVGHAVFASALNELLEGALSDEEERIILEIIGRYDEVSHPHNLRTRRIGADVAIDLHIRVDGAMRVDEAHQITQKIESDLRAAFGGQSFISLHVEPEDHDSL